MAMTENFQQTLDKMTAFLPVKEVREWGYTWEGMIPINLELAMYLVSHDANVPVYQLHYDDTESQIDEKEDILTDYTVTGDNIYGVDSGEWNYFLKSEDNQQLIKKFVPLQGAWDSFMRYLEEYKGDIGYNTRGYGPVREHLMDIGFTYDDISYLMVSYKKHYGYKFTDFSNQEETQIVYRYETMNNTPQDRRMTKWIDLSGKVVIKGAYSNEEISKRAADILSETPLDELNLRWENFLPVRRDYINNLIEVDIRALVEQARADINNLSSREKWHCKLADPKMPDSYIALTIEKYPDTVDFTAEFVKGNVKTDEISIKDIPLNDFMENRYTIAGIEKRVTLYGSKTEEGITRLDCYSNDMQPTAECPVRRMKMLTKDLPTITPDTRQYDSENKSYNPQSYIPNIIYKENTAILEGIKFDIVDEWLSGDDVFMILKHPGYQNPILPYVPYRAIVNGTPLIADFDTLPEKSEVISKYEDDLAEKDIDLMEQGQHVDTTKMTPSRKKQLEHYFNAICHSELHGEESKYPYLRDIEILIGPFPLETKSKLMDIMAYGRRLKEEDITNIRYIPDDRQIKFAADIHGMPDIIQINEMRGMGVVTWSKSEIESRLTEDEVESLNGLLKLELTSVDALKKIVPMPKKADNPSQKRLASEFVTAIKKMAQSEDSLDNFESYLSHHFSAWIKKYASTPEGITDEMKHFADIGAKEEKAEKAVITGRKM